MKQLFFSLALVAVFVSPASAQGNKDYDRKKEIVIEGNRYRIYNNYLTIGAGYGVNSYTRDYQFNLGGDFNFHIMKQNFQMGGFLAGQSFGNYNNIQGHFAYGKRFEQKDFNLAGYFGISYSSMNRSFEDDTLGVVFRYIQRPGFHACVQGTYKFKYDLGIGLAVFADVNNAQRVYGLRLELFLSGAYKGKRLKKESVEPEGGNN
jgi:hypothetical protein